jgi:hypothetical protein
LIPCSAGVKTRRAHRFAWHGRRLSVRLSLFGDQGDYRAILIQNKTNTFRVGGTLQTVATADGKGGNAGNLHLSAELNENGKITEVKDGPGFSVAAIPQNFTETFIPALDLVGAPGVIGIQVNVYWKSDSDELSDLDQVWFKEQVQVQRRTGTFTKEFGPSDYAPLKETNEIPAKDDSGVHDPHTTLTTRMKAPGGIADITEVHIFKDLRTGTKDATVKNSGYELRRVISQDPKTLKWVLVTTKTGLKVTANGFTSGAATTVPKAGIVSPPQS